jgi:hypothetical protein
VRNIEETSCLSHSQVFFDNPGVLDRHIPTAKIDHPRTKLTMELVQRGFFHRFSPLSLWNNASNKKS